MSSFPLTCPAIRDQQVMIAATYRETVILQSLVASLAEHFDAASVPADYPVNEVKAVLSDFTARLGNCALSLEAWHRASQTPAGLGG